MILVYIVFEGTDGSGKSTAIDMVNLKLKERFPELNEKIIIARQPGSTPLGKHIRKLVKTPTLISPDITISPLARQLLFMVDSINFTNEILEPALLKGNIVITDRSSYISSLVYGLTEGLDLDDIEKLFNISTPPKSQRMYLLICPFEVRRDRIVDRNEAIDYFDDKSIAFSNKIQSIYDNLLTTSDKQSQLISMTIDPENVRYIDTNRSLNSIVDDIVNDLTKLLTEDQSF